MYCYKCGVKLADTEKRCPLCDVALDHPQIRLERSRPLYPKNRYPKSTYRPRVINGALLFLYLIPIFITFYIDWNVDRNIEWFHFVAGGVALLYIVTALPVWFKKPNPVIFVPCDFAAIALYLLMINSMTNGDWYLTFALPITVCVGLIVTAMVALIRYLRQGKLYVYGGAVMAFGAITLLVELLLKVTFAMPFHGWSVYPFIVLFLIGGLLLFIAINSSVREVMERKFFV